MSKIIIKGCFTTLNEYINHERANKFKAAKIKKEETNLVFLQVQNKKIQTPCILKFTWHVKNKRKDPDNIAFSKKFILDGLVKAGVIPDDTHKHIEGFIDVFVISDDERVEVEGLKNKKHSFGE